MKTAPHGYNERCLLELVQNRCHLLKCLMELKICGRMLFYLSVNDSVNDDPLSVPDLTPFLFLSICILVLCNIYLKSFLLVDVN